MKGQSWSSSIIEQVLNISSGFIVSLLVWMYFVSPLFGIEVNFGDNLLITGIFCGVSIVRGLIWRRLFNWISVKEKEYVRPHKGVRSRGDQ